MSNNRLRCEVCKKDHFEVPIIEKPLRFCFDSKVVELSQLNDDSRKQDNICLNCLTEEILSLEEGH